MNSIINYTEMLEGRVYNLRKQVEQLEAENEELKKKVGNKRQFLDLCDASIDAALSEQEAETGDKE